MDVVADSGRQILGLLIVFSLLGWTVWKFGRSKVALPKLGLSSKERRLRSIERLSLSPQHTLHVVQVEGREILLATHPGGVTLLETAEVSSRSAHA